MNGPAKKSEPLHEVTIQLLVMFGLLAILFIGVTVINNNFVSVFSLRAVSRDVAIMSLFALGQAVVIMSGGIDLSVGSLMCFLGALTIVIVNSATGVPFVVIAIGILTLAGMIGAIHALFITKLNLQPFLVTLCSLLIFRGLARVLTQDSTVAFVATEHPTFTALGSGSWLHIPIPVFILIGVLIPLGVFLHFTVPGRYIYAIGYNVEAARYSGVRVHLLQGVRYVICAVLAAVAGLLEASDVGSVTPSNAAMAYEMYGITAAVLGGCALRGGQGSLLGVVVGAAILRTIRSAVIFVGISTYWTFAVPGLVLLAAVTTDALVRRKRGD